LLKKRRKTLGGYFFAAPCSLLVFHHFAEHLAQFGDGMCAWCTANPAVC